MISRNERDDSMNNRLFFTLEMQANLKVYRYHYFKQNVIYLETDQGNKIVKSYESKSKLRTQIEFSAHMREKKFAAFSSFESYPNGINMIEWNGRYWGIMPFIYSQPTLRFHFYNETNRHEGLKLLQTFHNSVSGSGNPVLNRIPRFSLREKWISRLEQFVQNGPVIMPYIGKQVYDDLVASGLDYFSYCFADTLSQLENEAFVKGKVIHGDCASHNFIRDQKGQLNLIDFDLISLAPFEYDYLQYASRILPTIQWSFQRLQHIQILHKALSHQWFLACLLYPNDLYREWNRVVGEQEYRIQKMVHLTLKEHQRRQKFCHDVLRMLK